MLRGEICHFLLVIGQKVKLPLLNDQGFIQYLEQQLPETSGEYDNMTLQLGVKFRDGWPLLAVLVV